MTSEIESYLTLSVGGEQNIHFNSTYEIGDALKRLRLFLMESGNDNSCYGQSKLRIQRIVKYISEYQEKGIKYVWFEVVNGLVRVYPVDE